MNAAWVQKAFLPCSKVALPGLSRIQISPLAVPTDTFQSMDEDREASPRARQMERMLSRKLAEFLDSKVPYTIRRVLAAEMQHLYVGPGHSECLVSALAA